MLSESVNFDRAAGFYDATRGFPQGVTPQLAEFIVKNAGLNPDDRLLEIGVGTGRLTLPLAPHVAHITGVDISVEMMRQLLRKRTNESVSVAQADAHQLPFGDTVFDHIMIIHVLHLVARPEQVLREVKRVLKHSGTLLHMRNRQNNDSRFQPIVDAWNKHKPPRKTGVDWFEGDDFILKAGWEAVENYAFTYTATITPRIYIDYIRNRYWSNMWGTTDEEIAIGLKAVESAIDTHLDGDLDQVIERQDQFLISRYRPTT